MHELWQIYSHCSQFSRNKSISLIPTHPQVHTHTHTYVRAHTYIYTLYTHINIHTDKWATHYFSAREYIYCFISSSLLPYETPVSSSRKFPHKTITIVSLQQHNMLCGSMHGIYYFPIVCYIFYTPIFLYTLMYLGPCSPDPSPHTPAESRPVQWPTATTQHCYDLLYRYVQWPTATAHNNTTICCTAMYNGPQPQHITILRSAVPLCTMAHSHST